MKNNLKPCPFCGNDDIMVYSKVQNFIYKDGTPMKGRFYYAECEHCGCSQGASPSKEMLIENWNTRAYERTNND